jgi:hypothetical protein
MSYGYFSTNNLPADAFQQKHASRYSSTNKLPVDAFQQKHDSRYSSTNNLPVDAFQQKHASRYSSTKTCLLMLFNKNMSASTLLQQITSMQALFNISTYSHASRHSSTNNIPTGTLKQLTCQQVQINKYCYINKDHQ